MSLWIKICGNTSLHDSLLAVEAGVDALGFVLAPSPRQVTAEQVAAILPHLPQAVEKIGVFVDGPLDRIVATVRASGLTGVQLHFEASPALSRRLRDQLGPALRILRTVHFGAGAGRQAPILLADLNVDALLVDSRTATAAGGTGIAFDWEEARKTLFRRAQIRNFRMVAAGGLNPENVAEAVAILHPWGVDVVSGVEAAPGSKHPDKVRAFVAQARAAANRARP